MNDQYTAVPVTAAMLDTWELIANAGIPTMRLGGVNWVLMVRSLIAEVRRLQLPQPAEKRP